MNQYHSMIAQHGAAPAWRARAVGTLAADLDIDLHGDRAATVTALLAACVSDADGHGLDAEVAWDWTLNQRLQGLIAMRLAAGQNALALQAACTGCDEAMSIDLDVQAFAAAPAAPRFSWRSDAGIELNLRLPNGRDLQAWARADVDSPVTFAASLVETIGGRAHALDDPALAAILPALDDAFAEHDPLICLRLRTACPACAHDNSIVCDLEAALLAGFARAQADLLDEVLQLARSLHWSEAQIMALPRWRRAHYLARLAVANA